MLEPSACNAPPTKFFLVLGYNHEFRMWWGVHLTHTDGCQEVCVPEVEVKRLLERDLGEYELHK